MSQYPRPTPIVLAIPSILSVAFGGVTYLILIRPYQLAAEARSWPEVPCVITESTVRYFNNNEGKTRFEPAVRYTYDIDGTRFEGSKLNFGSVNQVGEDASLEAIQPYPRGLRTTCRVRPGAPGFSVLEPAVRGVFLHVMGTVFGAGALMALTVSGLVWVRYFRMRPSIR